MAGQYAKRSGLPFVDLYQAGLAGLIHALDTFGCAESKLFRPCVSRWIRRRIEKTVEEHKQLLQIMERNEKES